MRKRQQTENGAKKRFRIPAIIMALLMVLSLFPVQAGAAQAPAGAATSYTFGSQGSVRAAHSFADTGVAFRDASFPAEAPGWQSNVYYPRVAAYAQDNSFVTEHDGYVEIAGRVWTEANTAEYRSYTYEDTSTLDLLLDSRDYAVVAQLYNPGSSALTVSVKAEEISKATDVTVPAGQTVEVGFSTCLIDGVLNLKFVETSENPASRPSGTRSVYLSGLQVTPVAEKTAGSVPTIYLASDSTVQTYTDYYDPQTGWGERLHEFFGSYIEDYTSLTAGYSQSHTYVTDQVVVENRAIGGRSSKSFIDEGKLDDLLEDIRPGDYLFVQWGHNDATYSRPNRYVSAADFEQYIQMYVDGAAQRGATCVLVTPVARRSYQLDADGNASFVSNFEAYRQVMIKMAAEQDLPLLDLTAASIAVANRFGAEGSKALFLHTNKGEYEGAYGAGVSDDTHLQAFGAYKFAQCVAAEILDSGHPALAPLQAKAGLNVPDQPPAAPAGLMLGNVASTMIDLSWQPVEGAELYYIYRQQLAEGQSIDDVDFTGAGQYSVTTGTSYTDRNCQGGESYVYAVRSGNDAGQSELSGMVRADTQESQYRYDFGISSDRNVMEGWTEVTEKTLYTEAVGYGWLTSPNNGRNRRNNGNAHSSPMADDCAIGAGEFAVDLPNGDYELCIYAGDLLSSTSTITTNYTAEGEAIGSISARQAIVTLSAFVRITDGRLNLATSGTMPYINGLEIAIVQLGPQALTCSEFDLNGERASFLLGFIGLDEAVSYNLYSLVDGQPVLVKSFAAADKEDLNNRAMEVTSGQKYYYYVTAVLANGTETAPTNTLEVDAIDPSIEPPAAPTGLAAGVVESGNVNLSWDAVPGATSYKVYRSKYAEGAPHYTGFALVDSAAANHFADTTPTVVTNIPYYYKVQAVGLGGESALSEALATPVTTTFAFTPAETLTDRALVAVNLAGDKGAQTNVSATDANDVEYTSGVYLSWRSFEADGGSATFTVYRDGTAIASGLPYTNLVDEGGTAASVYRVVGSTDAALGIAGVDTRVWQDFYQEYQLYKPAAQTMPDGSSCYYAANDMSVGDLDGDGRLELIVKWYPSNAQDNANSGYTGTTFLDAYDIDYDTGAARLMWRIDMGVNIRSGAHYTQFMVWDFDGDGRAEVTAKTADGTTTYRSADGTDAGLEQTGYVGACDAAALPTNTVSKQNDYRNSGGHILTGPEYFTVFDGETGAIIDTTDFEPARGNLAGWGDTAGNRSDRYTAGVAYLDGVRPSAVYGRGYYTGRDGVTGRTGIAAYNLLDTDGDGRGDTLDLEWYFNTTSLDYISMGNHGLSINDVDGDGRDEIIYGALVLDDDGTVLYCTGLGHGDAMHVGDWVESNPGLEIMSVHEHTGVAYHVEIHDAATGAVLMGYYVGKDTGRGAAADIDPTSPGAEFWSGAMPNNQGGSAEWNGITGAVWATTSTLDSLVKLSDNNPPANFTLFWDGDLLSEVQDHAFDQPAYLPVGVNITKWDYLAGQSVPLFYSEEVWSSNGTKGNVGLVADILGDWREEIIVRLAGNGGAAGENDDRVRIYTTTIQTDYVVPCLLENLAYREGIAWQNTAYNQPANLDYLLSEGVLTAGVGFGAMSDTTAELLFTPASDGTYGHAVQGYNIYRTAPGGEAELVATLMDGQLQQVPGDGPSVWVPGEVVAKYDFGNKSGTVSGYTLVTNGMYSASVGYGFTSEGEVAFSNVGVGMPSGWEGDQDLYKACTDLSRAGSMLSFRTDLAPGTYQVDVYATANANNSYYNDATISVNGKDLGTVYGGAAAAASLGSPDDIRKSAVVTVDEGGYIEVVSSNPGKLAILNAMVITAMEEKASPSQQLVYTWTDTGLEAYTTYAYQVQAIVDGKPGYLSRPAEVTTQIDVREVLDIVLGDIVQDTPLEDGQTLADLLPATVRVVDALGRELDAAVAWDVSGADLAVPGSYTVLAKVAGWAQPIAVPLEILENTVTGIAAFAEVMVITGEEPALPEKAQVSYLNGTVVEYDVTWDTAAVDFSQPGSYTVNGVLAGLEDRPVSVRVTVQDVVIVSVQDGAATAAKGADPAALALPATVKATWSNGDETDEPVVWSLEQIDTSASGVFTIEGTVAGFEGKAKLVLTVEYETVAMFDFGISTGTVAAGWTGVTTNAKGGTKTAEALGINYTTERGWGYANAAAKFEGRDEGDYNSALAGLYPLAAYRDFNLVAGQEFLVDLPNGLYEVTLLSGSSNSNALNGTLEGTVSFSVSHGAKDYRIVTQQVRVADGQLNIAFGSGTLRLNALVIKLIEADGDVQADKTALQALYDANKDKTNGQYTDASWTDFQAALANAAAVLANDSATQAEVDAAQQILHTAADGLLPHMTDGSRASMALSAYGSLTEALYTPESWAAFAPALAAVRDIQATPTGYTQAQADAAVDALYAAANGLKKALRPELLQVAINYAREQLESNSELTDDSKAALAQAIADAEAVLAGATTQDELDAARKALRAVTDSLATKGNVAALKRLAADADALNLTLYTEESARILTDVLAEVKAALDDEGNLTQRMIDLYTQALLAAVDGLRESLSYDDLNDALAEANAILDNADGYVQSTIAGLAQAKADAETVLASATTQDELDQAAATLFGECLKARKKADLSALQARLNALLGLNRSLYTRASLARLDTAVLNAQAVTEDDTQAAADQRLTELNAAVNALELIPAQPDPTPNPGTDDGGTGGTNGGTVTTPPAAANPAPGTAPNTLPAQTEQPTGTDGGAAGGEDGQTPGNEGETQQPSGEAETPVQPTQPETQPDVQAPQVQPQVAAEGVNPWMIATFGLLGAALLALLGFLLVRRRRSSEDKKDAPARK